MANGRTSNSSRKPARAATSHAQPAGTGVPGDPRPAAGQPEPLEFAETPHMSAQSQATGPEASGPLPVTPSPEPSHETPAGWEQPGTGTPADSPERRPEPYPAAGQRPQPYVRPRKPHKTQPPVNDAQADEAVEQSYVHESSYTLSSHSPIASSTYRRSRSSVSHVKKELKYGQYLSVPKGSREIFSSRSQRRKKQVLVALIVIAAVVAVALILLYMPR